MVRNHFALIVATLVMASGCATTPSAHTPAAVQAFDGTRVYITDKCADSPLETADFGAALAAALATTAANLAVNVASKAIDKAVEASEARYTSNTAYRIYTGTQGGLFKNTNGKIEPSGRCLTVINGLFVEKGDHIEKVGERDVPMAAAPRFALQVFIDQVDNATAFRLKPVYLAFNEHPGNTSLFSRRQSTVTVTLKLRTLSAEIETPEFVAHAFTFEDLVPGTRRNALQLEGHHTDLFPWPKADAQSIATARGRNETRKAAVHADYLVKARALRAAGVLCTSDAVTHPMSACALPDDVTAYSRMAWRDGGPGAHAHTAQINCKTDLNKAAALRRADTTLKQCAHLLSDGSWSAYKAQQLADLEGADKVAVERALHTLQQDLLQRKAQWTARLDLGRFLLDKATIDDLNHAKSPLYGAIDRPDNLKPDHPYYASLEGEPPATHLLPFIASAQLVVFKDPNAFLQALSEAFDDDTKTALTDALAKDLHALLDSDVKEEAQAAELAGALDTQIKLQNALDAVEKAEADLEAENAKAEPNPVVLVTLRNGVYTAKLSANKVFAENAKPLPYPEATTATLPQ